MQDAIAAGRLKKCLTRDGKIRSAELADAEWKATTHADRRPLSGPAGSSDSPDLGEARARLDLAKAELAELDLAERRSELLPVADVEAKMVADYSAVRNKLLGVPSRVRQRDPTLTAAQVALIEEEIREALSQIAVENLDKVAA